MIVRILAVTSSPLYPSPLVAAWIRMPFSYLREIAKPSNLSSAAYSISVSSKPSLQRRSKAMASLFSRALLSESIGTTCFTSVNKLLA